MKQCILFVILLLAPSIVHAQESVLPNGHYLIISAKLAPEIIHTDISVEECDVTTEKDGTFVTFPGSPKYPEYALKPIRVAMQKDHFEFSIGPTDYVTPNMEHLAMQTKTYVGQLFQGKLVGVVTTAGWASESRPVLFYKQQTPQ